MDLVGTGLRQSDAIHMSEKSLPADWDLSLYGPDTEEGRAFTGNLATAPTAESTRLLCSIVRNREL
jgi:hypothetical protein